MKGFTNSNKFSKDLSFMTEADWARLHSKDVCDYHHDSVGWDSCSESYKGNPRGCAVARAKERANEIKR